MDTVDVGQADPSKEFKDRSGVLIFFGVVLIGLGLFSGAMAALVVLGNAFAAASGAAQPIGPLVFNLLLYGGGGILLFVLGIGSIYAHRWARALTLVLMWVMLICGLMSLLFVPAMMAHFSIPLPEGVEAPSPQQMQVMKLIMMTVITLVLAVQVGLPIPFILVYRSPHTKATCEAKHPNPSWTDACPLPVLAVALISLYGAVSTALMALCMPMFAFLDRILIGAPAVGILLGMTTVLLLLAWGLYRLNVGAWWAAVLLLLVGAVFGGYTLYHLDMAELFEAIGLPAEQVEMLRPTGILEMYHQPLTLVMMGLVMLLYLGYFVYIRRFFAFDRHDARSIPPLPRR